jgi:hypothetical protein
LTLPVVFAETLPANCPAAGFPFAAEFRFLDGGTAAATSNVACPS